MFVALIALSIKASPYVIADAPANLHFANPGEWIQINFERPTTDTRPVHEVWNTILVSNGLYQVAVPTKSGNRSVRHVAYNPKTKERLKYHILFNGNTMLNIQFEEFETKSNSTSIELTIDKNIFQTARISYSPPAYCIMPISPDDFSSLSGSKIKSVMTENGCDNTAYGN
jgi:uncharacterized protein YdeI (BOF family)